MSGYLSVFGFHNPASSSSSSSSSGGALSLDNLTDVTQSAATDRQVLSFDNLVWKNKDIEFVCGVTGVTGAIHIGNGTVSGTSSLNSISIGSSSGLVNQGAGNVAIGEQSGKDTQADRGLAIGYYAAQTRQGSDSIGIGSQAQMSDSSAYSIGIGYQAGKSLQGQKSIAIGMGAASFQQADNNIAIGENAQYSGSTNFSIAIGSNSAQLNQAQYCTALGANAGQTNQGQYSLCLSTDAGKTSAGSFSVNVGPSAGELSAATYSTNIGPFAGQEKSQSYSVSVGPLANQGSGVTGAGSYSVGVGYNSDSSGLGAISIGQSSISNKANNVAIGSSAQAIGITGSIAIGYSAVASGAASLSLGNAALSNATNSTSLGVNSNSSATGAISIGYGAAASTANYCQIGQATNSGTGARLKYRSQIIGDEAWIDTNNRIATIDATGNFVKSTIDPSTLTSGIRNLNGMTGATGIFATATTGTDFTIATSGNTTTFAIPDASATARGLVNTGTQNYAGIKIFNSTPRFATSIIQNGSLQDLALPVGAVDTIVARTSTDTLTNKTMTGATNTITARLLKTATNEVSVSAATAPTTNQVLMATSATTATWQTLPVSINSIPGYVTGHTIISEGSASFAGGPFTLTATTMTPANFYTIGVGVGGYRIIGTLIGSSSASVTKTLNLYLSSGSAPTARITINGVVGAPVSIDATGVTISSTIPADTSIFMVPIDVYIYVTAVTPTPGLSIRMCGSSGTFSNTNSQLRVYDLN